MTTANDNRPRRYLRSEPDGLPPGEWELAAGTPIYNARDGSLIRVEPNSRKLIHWMNVKEELDYYFINGQWWSLQKEKQNV